MVLVGMVSLAACAGSNPSNGDGGNHAHSAEKTTQPPVQTVVIDATRPPEKPGVITISAIRTSGDTLMVDVTYSGGCKPHEFKLYSTGMWMKSLPPKVNVSLSHTMAEPDPCRQMVRKTLKFLIRPLRYRGNNKVVVLMQGTDLQAEYSYPKD